MAALRKKPKKAAKKRGDGPGQPRARTPQQLDRQEKAYNLSVLHGKTVREIAVDLKCDKDTVVSDLRHEGERRAEEISDRREIERSRAVNFYEGIIGRALTKSELYDTLLAERAGAKISDHSLEAAIKARERIDKVLGLDAPTKVEMGLQSLLDALDVPLEGA